jgi:hypothetical protein
MMQSQTFIPSQNQQILRLFSNLMTKGWWYRLFARITHRTCHLLELDKTLAQSDVENSHYAGLQTVELDRIRGTEGKSDAFDDQFHPRSEKARDRWFRIAFQKLNGHPLPPVELIDVDGTYYVRDGHHRISVARWLGETYIDAEIIVMDLNRRIR